MAAWSIGVLETRDNNLVGDAVPSAFLSSSSLRSKGCSVWKEQLETDQSLIMIKKPSPEFILNFDYT
jgi:hypothetical protein